MNTLILNETIDIYVCRRFRDSPKPCCVDNLSKEDFLRMQQELEANYRVTLIPSGCQGLCPYKGFAIRSGTRPEVVESVADFRKKIEAYKKVKVSESDNGYSNR